MAVFVLYPLWERHYLKILHMPFAIGFKYRIYASIHFAPFVVIMEVYFYQYSRGQLVFLSS